MKILIVEDSEVRTLFFEEAFKNHSLDFSTTSTSAICLLEDDEYDCIFLDMDLDDGLAQGIEVAKKIPLSESRFADVIVHSMNIDAADRVGRLLPGVLIIPFAELRLNIEKHGEGWLEERASQ